MNAYDCGLITVEASSKAPALRAILYETIELMRGLKEVKIRTIVDPRGNPLAHRMFDGHTDPRFNTKTSVSISSRNVKMLCIALPVTALRAIQKSGLKSKDLLRPSGHRHSQNRTEIILKHAPPLNFEVPSVGGKRFMIVGVSVEAAEGEGATMYLLDGYSQWCRVATRGVNDSGVLPFSVVALVVDAASKEILYYNPMVLHHAFFVRRTGQYLPRSGAVPGELRCHDRPGGTDTARSILRTPAHSQAILQHESLSA